MMRSFLGDPRWIALAFLRSFWGVPVNQLELPFVPKTRIDVDIVIAIRLERVCFHFGNNGIKTAFAVAIVLAM